MNFRVPISDSDLQAYADEQLGHEQRIKVEAYIREHPEAAATVEEFQRLNKATHELYDSVVEEPLPTQFIYKTKIALPISRVAAMMAWLLVGGILGWQLHPNNVELAYQDTLEFHLVQPAAFAHSVFAPEITHPVEVQATEQQHLVAWLSKRLHTQLKAPILENQGYALVGGRLLPSTNRMAAQFMYERNDGARVTLYTRRSSWKNKMTAFHYALQNETAVLYWIDESMGYALVGNLEKDELISLSNEIYRQLNQGDA